MTKREERNIERKKSEWDESLSNLNRWWRRTYRVASREVSYNMNNWLDWYFGDGRQKGLHKYMRRFAILCVDIILLRLLHFI